MSKYISLKKAAKIAGYAPDYLGYLIRKKQLGGRKIGRNWFTTEESLRAYLSSGKYLSLENNVSPRKSVFQSIVSPELFLILFICVVVAGVIFWQINSSVVKSEEPGDFDNTIKLQTKKIPIGEEGSEETLREFQKFNVSTFLLDEDGDVGISVQEILPNKKSNEEKSDD